MNLGGIHAKAGRLDEAIEEFSAAARKAPKNVGTHIMLGQAYLMRGMGEEAAAELNLAKAIPTEDPSYTAAIRSLLSQALQLGAMRKRLAAVLDGKDKPKDVGEWTFFLQAAYEQRHYAGAAKFAEAGLTSEPKLSDVTMSVVRYNAACCAALAPAGKGVDDSTPSDDDRAKFRAKAAGWLRDDLDAWNKVLAGRPQVAQGIDQAIQYRKKDTDLAAIRDAPALAKLPDPEREICRKRWADVDDLLRRCSRKP